MSPSYIPLPSDRPRAACTRAHVTALIDLVQTADALTAVGEKPLCLPDILRMFDQLDPATAPDSPVLVEAVFTFLDGDLSGPQERAWFSYAHHARCRLSEEGRAVTVDTADLHAVLSAAERHGEAIAVQDDFLGAHRCVEDIGTGLVARKDYALALHEMGCCRLAADEILGAWDLWRHDEQCSEARFGLMLARACLTILLGCRRFTDARTLLAEVPRGLWFTLMDDRTHDARLIADAAAHAPVCTMAGSTPTRQAAS